MAVSGGRNTSATCHRIMKGCTLRDLENMRKFVKIALFLLYVEQNGSYMKFVFIFWSGGDS
jgi:hypothetical protein